MDKVQPEEQGKLSQEANTRCGAHPQLGEAGSTLALLDPGFRIPALVIGGEDVGSRQFFPAAERDQGGVLELVLRLSTE